jgi:hypothetical protein
MSTLMTSSAEQRLALCFANGARVYLYHFANGRQVAMYQKADGSIRRFDSFIIRPNGYATAPQWGAWLSRGWSYEFPHEIEGSCRYTLEPLDSLEIGFGADPEGLFEGLSDLINDDSGVRVGLAVTEPLDARVMQDAPSNQYRH